MALIGLEIVAGFIAMVALAFYVMTRSEYCQPPNMGDWETDHYRED